ncbi:MAG TPA: GNAT family N-acetyltransferase [Kofleriaceae bacterium]
MTSAASFRPYAPGDEAQILELYQLAFGIALSLDEWHWHYDRGAIIELAEVDGRIVGHYAVQPRPFHIGARTCRAGLVIGSMVAPEHRNITTFLELAKRAYGECRVRGIPFVYAFPNDNVWLVRRRMLSWHALPSIAMLGAATRPSMIDATTSGVERLAGDSFPSASWLGATVDDRIRSRDAPDFMQWRLRARPGVEYPVYIHRESGELRGYIALKRYVSAAGAVGHLVAFRVAPGAELSSGMPLLARAFEHFTADGVDRVTTWMLPASPLYAVILGAGFAPEHEPKKNFGYLAFDDEIAATLARADSWDIAMTDSDVY